MGGASLNSDLSRPIETDRETTSGRGKPGFTLVEIIVVLVIIAILAAIAVPALTGYIDKAKDKDVEMKARNMTTAVRTLLTETYTTGELAKNHSGLAHYDGYIDNGASDGGKLRKWNLDNVSIYLTGTERGLYQQIASLKGEKDQGNNANPGFSSYFILGPQDSTILTTDAFCYRFFPEGLLGMAGKPCIYVTYNINRLNLADGAPISGKKGFETALTNNGVYNPNAGYEVYHLTVS